MLKKSEKRRNRKGSIRQNIYAGYFKDIVAFVFDNPLPIWKSLALMKPLEAEPSTLTIRKKTDQSPSSV